MTGQAIAELARGWVGTPFVWQGRVRGQGCDCKGLVAGVAAEAGLPVARSIEALAADYDATVDVRRLRRGLDRLFDAVPPDAVAAGDVLLLNIGGRAQHLAICTAVRDGAAWRMVHVYPSLGKVVEVPLGTAWRSCIAGVFRWKVD